MTEKGISFIIRQKSNATYRVAERYNVIKSKGLMSDQTIEFTGPITSKKCPVLLRRIGYRNPETRKYYFFLANNFKLTAKTIA